MQWVLFAINASVFWGLTYVLDEQIFKHISVPTTLFVHMLAVSAIVGVLAASNGELRTDLAEIGTDGRLLWLVLAATITLAIAELSIGYSISGKNATIASLVEISYPLFTAIFAFLIFGETELSTGTAIGGTLICLGVCVVYLAN